MIIVIIMTVMIMMIVIHLALIFSLLHKCPDQFLNKRDELQMFIAGNEPDIILVSEILPKSYCNTILSSTLSLNGYNMFFNFDTDNFQAATS